MLCTLLNPHTADALNAHTQDPGVFFSLVSHSPSTGVYFKYLPYIILGTLAVVSAFAVLFLPESFGRPLPETIQQMHKRER